MNNPPPSPAPEPRDGTRPVAKLGINKLRRKLGGRWIHPQTSFYLQALFDGLLFVIIGGVLYEAVVAIRLATPRTSVGASTSFFQLLAQSSWVATVFGVATGFSIGSFYDALRRWKLEEVAEHEASDPEQATATPAPRRIRKYVTLGRLRMPYWLYMTSTVILALALPAFASVTVREIWSCWAKSRGHPGITVRDFQDSMTSFVGAILFCLIDVVAIVARLVIVMRYLPRLEPTSPDNVEEKWETADTAPRSA
ncbi:hypothetical protein PG994_005654 [Apiospora phragmitis]|uniref:Uncharacterized protein n=1 Tax=Apiospora phragmitis TaxID=2905665 RepID=A0ABR1VCX7_9PEZI